MTSSAEAADLIGNIFGRTNCPLILVVIALILSELRGGGDARDMLNIPSFLTSSPSLKFPIFLYLSPIGHFDIADPSTMQDACHHELSKYDLCSPRVSQ